MSTPALPQGFVLEEETQSSTPPLPAGFQLETGEDNRGFFEKTEETFKDVGQQTGRKFLSALLASPKTFSDFISFGSNFLAEKGREQQGKEEIDDFTKGVLGVLGFPSKILDKIGYPSQDEFEDMIMKFAEFTGSDQLSKDPKTKAGKIGGKVGEFAGASVLGGPKTLAERLLFGSLGGLGAGEAEELGAGTGGQLGAAIALPTIVQLIYAIKTGKFVPNTAEMEELAQFFRSKGMSEAEIVPLLQPKVKQKALGRIAKSDEKLDAMIGKKGSVETKLGQGFEDLKQSARELPPASQKQVETLIDEFQGISDSLRQSKLPSDEKLAAIKKIDSAVEDLWQNGITPEGIIETSIDINDAVNWNSYKQGKKDLAKLKKPLKDLYKEISPEGAATFDKLNEGWSRLKSIQKNIGDNNIKVALNYGKGLAYLTTAVNSVVKGDIQGLVTTGATALGVEMSQYLAKKMLTDPKYQNILLKTATAVKKGSRPQMLKAYDELVSETLKDNPDLAKQVDWDSLKNKSGNQ